MEVFSILAIIALVGMTIGGIVFISILFWVVAYRIVKLIIRRYRDGYQKKEFKNV